MKRINQKKGRNAKIGFNYWLIFFFSMLLIDCAPERNNPISRGFHNTAAHYNAYWIAEGRIREVEQAIDRQHQENYNKVLPIFSEFDTTFTKTLETEIEDCVKKASLVVQRHPNSQWIYPSYVLIGKSRFYSGQYARAIETFKYVNTKSEDDDARHEALILLIRTFLDYQEKNNAVAVSDFLRKEKLNKSNLRDLYLTRAYMYQLDENYDEMVKNLALAVPLVSNSKKQARIYFIIGQIYQKIGFEAQAFDNYQKCLKNNPEYELYFYCRLNMAQVSDLSKQSDVRKIRKYFLKLLSDTKNEEFKDKIYYEMGEFEVKQLDYPKAIEFYQLSAQVSTSNKRQQAYSYLRLGEIHYEELKKYELAQAYYDSTIRVLPIDEKNYEKIKQRQEILADFVKQLNTIEEQDSLLSLSQMDSVALSAYIDEAILLREAQDEALAKAAKKKRARSGSAASASVNIQNPFTAGSVNEGSVWYFYSPTTVSVGETEFKRIWGDRPLEDHWRRSQKQSQAISSNGIVSDQEQVGNNVGGSESEVTQSKYNRGEMMAAVPVTEEAKMQALAKIENAFYKLGNIYYFNLIEKDNAISSFKILLRRFPKTDYEPEVLYQLYLIYLDQKTEEEQYYRNRLVNEFPKSSFAKVIVNPNYLEENNAASEQAQEYYKQAYEYFQNRDYAASNLTINKAIRELPENDFTDNLILLQVLMVAPTENIYNYQFALGKFIQDYPDSDVAEYAQELIDTSKNFVKRAVDKKGAEFIDFFEQSHYFVLVYDISQSGDEMSKAVDQFVQNNFADGSLKTATLIFNDAKSMILIDQFSTQALAREFYKKFNQDDSLSKVLVSTKNNNFVISRDNFQIFYQTKDIDTYLTFFEKHYL